MGNRQNTDNRKKSLNNYLSLIACSLLVFTFFLFSCSTASVQLNSNSIRIDKVPFYPQDDYQCGPAALAGVLNYWGINVTPDDIAKDIYSKFAKGTLNIEMKIYADKKGLYSLQYRGNWDDLKSKISEGNPLIVLVDYGVFSSYHVNHFMVVIGYNDEGVIVNSERTENLFIEKEKFLRIWKKANYWTLLIRQRTEAREQNTEHR